MTVEGERLAEALGSIRRNGKLYSPFTPEAERLVPVDRVAFAELVAIRAVLPATWDDLPLAPVEHRTAAEPPPAPTEEAAPQQRGGKRKARKAATGEGGETGA